MSNYPKNNIYAILYSIFYVCGITTNVLIAHTMIEENYNLKHINIFHGHETVFTIKANDTPLHKCINETKYSFFTNAFNHYFLSNYFINNNSNFIYSTPYVGAVTTNVLIAHIMEGKFLKQINIPYGHKSVYAIAKAGI